MSVTVLPGDMLERLAEMEPASLDACVTDPPYGLAFMGKGWDHAVPGVDYWRAVYRVLKPGAHVFAFGGTRTFHRMVCAIEDAGFRSGRGFVWRWISENLNAIRIFSPLMLGFLCTSVDSRAGVTSCRSEIA
jgi:DNA modification methylase